jgi:hypothetical protein
MKTVTTFQTVYYVTVRGTEWMFSSDGTVKNNGNPFRRRKNDYVTLDEWLEEFMGVEIDQQFTCGSHTVLRYDDKSIVYQIQHSMDGSPVLECKYFASIQSWIEHVDKMPKQVIFDGVEEWLNALGCTSSQTFQHESLRVVSYGCYGVVVERKHFASFKRWLECMGYKHVNKVSFRYKGSSDDFFMEEADMYSNGYICSYRGMYCTMKEWLLHIQAHGKTRGRNITYLPKSD